MTQCNQEAQQVIATTVSSASFEPQDITIQCVIWLIWAIMRMWFLLGGRAMCK